MTLPRPPATGTDRLNAYRQEKLKLGECLIALMHAAQSRHDYERAAQVRELAARLAEDRFQLAVMGQFSRGKSTLMNAILGSGYLPTGARPMTSVITRVVYGSQPRLTVERSGGLRPLEAPLKDLASYVVETGVERQQHGVKSVVVEVPAEILRLGFCFVDSPGIGSAIVANTDTARSFLSQTDAVVLVTSFDSPLTEAEITFLRSTREQLRRIFVVLNKRDLVSSKEASEVESFVTARLEGAGLVGARVYSLSAKDGLAAKLDGDPHALARSGLPAPESELIDYLTHRKAQEFLLQVAERAGQFVGTLLREATLAGALGRDPATKQAALQALGEAEADMAIKQRQLLEAVNSSVAEFSQRLPEASAKWAVPLRSSAVSLLSLDERSSKEGRHRRDLVPQLEGIGQSLHKAVSSWSEDVVGKELLALENTNRPSLLALSRTRSELWSQVADRWWPPTSHQGF